MRRWRERGGLSYTKEEILDIQRRGQAHREYIPLGQEARAAIGELHEREGRPFLPTNQPAKTGTAVKRSEVAGREAVIAEVKAAAEARFRARHEPSTSTPDEWFDQCTFCHDFTTCRWAFKKHLGSIKELPQLPYAMVWPE